MNVLIQMNILMIMMAFDLVFVMKVQHMLVLMMLGAYVLSANKTKFWYSLGCVCTQAHRWTTPRLMEIALSALGTANEFNH